MTNKTAKTTRAQALAFAIERCVDSPDVVEVLNRMYKQVTAPRKKVEGPTANQLKNDNFVKEVKSLMLERGTESINTKWVVENVEGITTPQKATAVLRRGAETGVLVACVTGKTTDYVLA